MLLKYKIIFLWETLLRSEIKNLKRSIKLFSFRKRSFIAQKMTVNELMRVDESYIKKLM